MWWLTTIGAVPVAGAVLLAVVPRGRDELAKQVALGASLLALVLSIAMAAGFDPSGARFQYTYSHAWISQFGARYSLGVDGIALALILLTTALVPIVLLASWREATRRGPRVFFGLVLSLEAMLIGVFASTNLFLFYMFFEAMLIPMYFIIGSYGGSAGAQRSYAAVKFFLYSLFGGLLMLAAVIGVYVVSSHQLGHGTFEFSQTTRLHYSGNVEKGLFMGFFIAFAIKAPLWPFHTWLPDAAAEAPAGGAVLLVGVLDKVGTFGMLRYCLPLFPHASKFFAPMVLSLSLVGIFYGALLAIGQRDLKRLIAYTSIAHFGFIALGIFAFTAQGQSGSTLYMVNHGFSTGALFLLVGFLWTRRRTTLIADYSGVQKVAPWLAGTFLLAGLSSLALPGMSTFVSEFLVLVGTFARYRVYAIVGTCGIVLAALYILLVVQRTMHGPLNPQSVGMTDLTRREAWVIAPMLIVIVFLGVYPKSALDFINPGVKATLSDTHSKPPAPSVPPPNALSTGGSR